MDDDKLICLSCFGTFSPDDMAGDICTDCNDCSGIDDFLDGDFL